MILEKWNELLIKYTDVKLTSKKALAISLVLFVLMVIGAIFVLSLPERVSTRF